MDNETLDEQLIAILKKIRPALVNQEEIDKITTLIKKGANPNSLNGFPLMLACRLKSIEAATIILEAGANVNTISIDGSPLGILCNNYNDVDESQVLKLVQLLLKYKADPNNVNSRCFSPLGNAIFYGLIDVAILLINNGANVNHLSSKKSSPLILAVSKKSTTIELVRLLLEHGVDINAVDSEGNNALYHLIDTPNSSDEVLIELIKSGIDLHVPSRWDDSPLHAAARKSRTSFLKILLKQDELDINIKDKKGYTPLSKALERSAKLDTLKLLFYAGASFEKKGSKTTRLLQAAAKYGDLDFIKDIVKKKTNKNHSGGALYYAAGNGNLSIVRYFIEELGVSTEENPHEYTSTTALLNATSYQKKEVVQYLLEKGADVQASDPSNNSALLLAATKGFDDIIELLVQHNAFIDAKNESNWNALMLAVFHKKASTVKLLVENNISMDAKGSKYGLTVFDLVKKCNNKTIKQFFKKYQRQKKAHIGKNILTMNCSVCKSFADYTNIPEQHQDIAFEGFDLLKQEKGTIRYGINKFSIYKCKECQSLYSHYYAFSDDFHYPTYENELLRLSLLQSISYLKKAKDKSLLNLHKKNYHKRIEHYKQLIQNGYAKIPVHFKNYIRCSVLDYFLEEKDWAGLEKNLLQNKDAQLVLDVIRDCIATMYEETYYAHNKHLINRYKDKPFSDSDHKKVLSFLKQNKTCIISYFVPFKDDKNYSKKYIVTYIKKLIKED